MDNEHHTTPPTSADRTDEKTPKRAGDILGLSDADPAVQIPQATTDRSPSHLSDQPSTSQTTAFRQTKGATGIDMGAGGTGTDVEPATTRRSETE